MIPIRNRLKADTGEAIPAEDQKDDVHACSDVKPTVTLVAPANCNSICTITAVLSKGTMNLKNVYFKLDGTTMSGGAFDVSGSATSQSMTIEPDFSGNHDITVEVVDEGLYDNTSAASTVNFIAVPFVLDSVTSPGSNFKFTWDDIGAGSYSVNYTGSNSGSQSLTCHITGSKCTDTVPQASFGGSGSYNFTIESSSPNRTSNTKSN
jgi:hypothetical protein